MAVVAECLQVIEAVRTAACDVEDMVNLQALGTTALNTPIAVALEGLFAEFFGCSSGWVLPHVCLLCALLQS